MLQNTGNLPFAGHIRPQTLYFQAKRKFIPVTSSVTRLCCARNGGNRVLVNFSKVLVTQPVPSKGIYILL